MVDIEHGTLRALEQDAAARLARLVEALPDRLPRRIRTTLLAETAWQYVSCCASQSSEIDSWKMCGYSGGDVVMNQRQQFDGLSYLETTGRKVEGGVDTVQDSVVVWADQDHVREVVLAAAAEPPDVMPFADVGSVAGAGSPFADLAAAVVQGAQGFNMLPVTPDRLGHQVPASLFRQAGLLVPHQGRDCGLIPGQQQGFKALFGNQAGARLERHLCGVGGQQLMVGLGETADGRMPLERSAEYGAACAHRQPADQHRDVGLTVGLEIP
nr:hypothetical protein [Azospirillum aestuarii]